MLPIHGSQLPLVPANHENPLSPGVWKRTLFTRDSIRPGIVQMVNWATLPAGKSFAPHYHEDMQEVFVIVAGRAHMTADGQTVVLQSGDAVLIEPREIHQMHNRDAEEVHYVVLGVSAGQGGRTVVVDRQ